MAYDSPFAPPPLDTRGIYALGDTIGGALENRRMDKLRQSYFQNGSTDYNGLVSAMQKALAAGDMETARSLGVIAKSMQQEDLTPYQKGALGIQRERLDWQKGQPPAPKIGSVIERIRDKLARGEALTPGMQRVYDDAIRLSTTERIMREEDVGNPPSVPVNQVQTVPIPAPAAQPPVTTDRPVSKGPLPMPGNKNELENGQVYDLPNGKQGLWNGTAFELLQ